MQNGYLIFTIYTCLFSLDPWISAEGSKCFCEKEYFTLSHKIVHSKQKLRQLMILSSLNELDMLFGMKYDHALFFYNLLNIYYDDFVTFWLKRLKTTNNAALKVLITLMLRPK